MRHIELESLIKRIFADAAGKKHEKRLLRAHKKLTIMAPPLRQAYLRRNGPNKWSPVKNRLIAVVGEKCWYTEVELVGAPLTIDHYRPICDYWYLALDPENYRIACPFANSPQHNPLYGCAGGKGDRFPLADGGLPAAEKASLGLEKPIILDPCRKQDCDLIAFQADGRPIVNPSYAGDATATRRVEQSNLLLNLDHPDFNSKRERLCHEIAQDVGTYEDLPNSSPFREAIRSGLKAALSAGAPFSTAARYYLKLHRHLQWVEDLLEE
jgi:hypothetical protein